MFSSPALTWVAKIRNSLVNLAHVTDSPLLGSGNILLALCSSCSGSLPSVSIYSMTEGVTETVYKLIGVSID